MEPPDVTVAYAHSANAAGFRHRLVDHLRSVAQLARSFAEPWGGGEAAYYLGLWHDLGKFHPDWQRYLLNSEAADGNLVRGPDHKGAGARLAEQHLGLAALVIQGHHGGLASPADYRSWMAGLDWVALREALDLARQSIRDVEPESKIPLPQFSFDRLQSETYLRVLFSTLVDADYLDTESHFWPERTAARHSNVSLDSLLRKLEEHVSGLMNGKTGPVAEVRREVFEACVRAAQGPTGVYRLAAPTGSGKTLASMAFALNHAVRHGLQRVIVAVPFISITEQTAQVFRCVFEGEVDAGQVVLEHHSGVAQDLDDETFRPRHAWSRLAAENWDAPVVVTTTVQLFESLFADRPSRCRKVHRLARSVIIVDEAQSLPVFLLRPILDAVRRLCELFGTTVLLSTATQPAFHAIREFSDVPSTDIIPDPALLFHRLRRVEYRWLLASAVSWEKVAAILRGQNQGLAVVNTKKDALALLDALQDPRALHLSTLLCGAHRRNVIEDVKQRLRDGSPCRVVSTQVIEAGVDLDFPFVMRALGPLDSIIQAAGRCNREGRLDAGQVVVFRPEEGGTPAGAYRVGIGITGAILASGGADPDDPALATEYFRQLFVTIDTDRERIQPLREAFNFREIARRFRMIDDETYPVVVTSYGTPEERGWVRSLLSNIQSGQENSRLLVRALQPFVVSLRQREADRLRSQGLVRDVAPGLGEWLGEYDPVRGLVTSGYDVEALVV